MNHKKIFLAFAALLFSNFLFSQTISPEDTGETLSAGFAKIDITPDIPVKLYGYASRKTYSEGVHDPLSARVVVFENNGRKLVLVSTDIGSYGKEVFPAIQKSILDKFNIKESELFLSTIHSHSSPVLSLNKESGDPNNIKYTETLNQKLLTVIEQAFKNLKPVHTGVGRGYSPVGSNRREMKSDGSVTLGRNPYGITDKEVLVMKVTTPEGLPVGAIVDYATHSTSLGPGNMMISGDVLGLSEQFVEKILGNGFVAPFFAGASGNIDPWYRVLPEFNNEPGWIPEPVLLGTLLGEEVVHVFRSIKEINQDTGINTASATIECPGRKLEGDASIAAEDRQVKTVPVRITVAGIGKDVGFVGFNVEMLTEIGMAVKAASPFRHTFIITHCNGSSGYLPPAELYKEGGYEIDATPFEPGSAEMVIKETLRMLYDLK